MDAPSLARAARYDLEAFHAGFLAGDVKAFRSARAMQSREREAYKIHEPLPDGRYESKDDLVSAQLKDRFSTE